MPPTTLVLGVLLSVQLCLPSQASPAPAPADSPWLQVVDNALTPQLLAVLQERFPKIKDVWKRIQGATSSAQWIDARANDGRPNPLEEPADILEALVHALITAVPALQSNDWDVVELFGHNRLQTQPQWFHFDSAEYEGNQQAGALVRMPTYSAILYLADEDETHFGVFPNGLACDNEITALNSSQQRPGDHGDEESTSTSARQNKQMVEPARTQPAPATVEQPQSPGRAPTGERFRCPAGGIQGFDPPHADYLHLVKPRFGRLLVIDGSRMHGNLAAPRNIPGKPRRYVIGICFYKQRPTLRGLGNVPEFVKHGPRGARAHMPVFALPADMQAGGGAGSTGNAVHLERTRYAGAVAAASAAAVGSGAASALSTASSHSAGGVLKMPVLSPGTSPNSNKTPRFLAMASQTSGWQSVAVDIKVPGARKVLQVRLPLPDSAGLRACEYCSVMFHDAPFADSAGSANIDGGATHSNRNRVNLHFEGRTVPSSQSRMRNYSPATDVEADTLSLKLRRAKRLERTLQEREVLQKEKGLRGGAAVAARLQPAGERDASEF